jgi:hypothetical protein
MVKMDKYDINVDVNDTDAFVMRILSSDKYFYDEFTSNLIGNEYFGFTDLYYGRNEEYNKKYDTFWDDNFVKYCDEHLNENNDYSKVTLDFDKLRYETIGYPHIKNVCIAYTKNDLDFIENNYINSKYLQEISENYFDDNILVLVSFTYKSSTYPKNWKIINENNKYVFTVENWEMISVKNDPVFPYIAYRILFLISIKKSL